MCVSIAVHEYTSDFDVFHLLQYIVESARQRPAKRRASSGGKKSLYQKLYELYIEECDKEPELKVTNRNQSRLYRKHLTDLIIGPIDL